MHFWKDRSVVERFKERPAVQASDAVILDTAHETHWEI